MINSLEFEMTLLIPDPNAIIDTSNKFDGNLEGCTIPMGLHVIEAVMK
jgi:hypothetical protein